MLAAISDWLRHVVILVLFAAILDQILPTSAMQRYVRTVLGLVIVLSLLLPIRALMAGLFSGAWESALTGPLVASWQAGVKSPVVAAGVSYSQEVRNVLQMSLEQGLPAGSISVEVATNTQNDGNVSVSGVLITGRNLGGYVFQKAEAQALQVQAAELLGLSLADVHVEYPGGEV